MAFARPDAPPFFIVHGDHDTISPVEAVRHFADALSSVSANPVVYAELPGARHAFDLFHSLRYEMVVDAVEAFTAWFAHDSLVTCVFGWSGRRESNPHRELGKLEFYH